ncbi:hypothetical protein B0H13DRAFT_1877228 [Mycena leptocephala]|nr:hypothetical protein B0H13DRAFT_1877228 [Mycena leptocephala]
MLRPRLVQDVRSCRGDSCGRDDVGWTRAGYSSLKDCGRRYSMAAFLANEVQRNPEDSRLVSCTSTTASFRAFIGTTSTRPVATAPTDKLPDPCGVRYPSLRSKAVSCRLRWDDDDDDNTGHDGYGEYRCAASRAPHASMSFRHFLAAAHARDVRLGLSRLFCLHASTSAFASSTSGLASQAAPLVIMDVAGRMLLPAFVCVSGGAFGIRRRWLGSASPLAALAKSCRRSAKRSARRVGEGGERGAKFVPKRGRKGEWEGDELEGEFQRCRRTRVTLPSEMETIVHLPQRRCGERSIARAAAVRGGNCRLLPRVAPCTHKRKCKRKYGPPFDSVILVEDNANRALVDSRTTTMTSPAAPSAPSPYSPALTGLRADVEDDADIRDPKAVCHIEEGAARPSAVWPRGMRLDVLAVLFDSDASLSSTTSSTRRTIRLRRARLDTHLISSWMSSKQRRVSSSASGVWGALLAPPVALPSLRDIAQRSLLTLNPKMWCWRSSATQRIKRAQGGVFLVTA